jgi:DNA adenine methylase
MQYLGGKTRIAKHIAAEIDKVRRPGQLVWDAFCGGLSVSRALLKNGPVLSTDACAPLIHLYRAVQNGWQPPTEVDEATYRATRSLPDTNPMKAFCGFGMSFGAKWFGGLSRPRPKYARPAEGAARVLRRDVVGLTFGLLDFMSETPRALDGVLYLDPPYQGTTGYDGAAPFNSVAFAARVAEWARFVPVFVSEYTFPLGSVVWQGESKTTVACGMTGAPKIALEKLFYLGPPKKTAPSAETLGAAPSHQQEAEE